MNPKNFCECVKVALHYGRHRVSEVIALGLVISWWCHPSFSKDDASSDRPVLPPITALAFSRDFQHVISGSQDGIAVRTWPKLDLVETKDVALESVHDIAFSPNGKHLLLAGGSPSVSGIVQLRSWPELKLEQVWSEHKDVVYQVAWKIDGQEWVSVSWDGFAKITRLEAKGSHVTMTSHSGPVFAATYLGGETVASAGTDRTIAVWKPATGESMKVLRQHTGTVHALALQPSFAAGQERLLASASEDRTVRFWQPNLGRMVRFLRLTSIPRSIAWSPDGAWLIVACDDGSIVQIDPVTLKMALVSHSEKRVLGLLVLANGEGICLADGANVKFVPIRK